jgi:hypothetical protein
LGKGSGELDRNTPEYEHDKHPEKLLVTEYAYWSHGQTKGENSKTPSPAKMDSKGTGEEKTEKNRQDRK